MKAILGIAGPDLLFLKIENIVANYRFPLSFAYWNSEKRWWTFPFTDLAVTTMKKEFGNNLIIDPTFYLAELNREMKIRKYSIRTRHLYLSANSEFLRYIRKDPMQVENEDVKNFLSEYISKKDPSSSTINCVINGLKFFYGSILTRKFMYSFNRPRRDKKLPSVLSKEEIALIINKTINLKHKTLLSIIYSAGLRVSEAVKLRKDNIDFIRKCINIRSGKGRKDRMTLLSEKTSKLLIKYLDYERSKSYVFPGQNRETHLSIRSAQAIFMQSLKRAGIEKNVSIHSLRHSFATHLLENGIDIRFIQHLLGHKNLITTEIYTHVSKKSFMNIKSPFDTF
jgi:integrase/recombinase XerD